VRGFDTYFLGEAKTEEAGRVARMENDAIRFESPTASGPSAGGLDYILRDLQANEYLRESARAAELVQASLEPVHSGDNRGVKQAGYAVLTTARRPAILVEMGFSTNPEDGRLLSSRNSQRQLARAIAEAIVNYLHEFERKSGVGPDTAGRGR
jgi:N-acetylmuramoyl-L-alanine amidase